ncbi:MAG: hypothetical protein Q7R33_08000 [Nitrosarchaeum sp.]|nr:hypothetical protein [Nitrosarchaeum sp.]
MNLNSTPTKKQNVFLKYWDIAKHPLFLYYLRAIFLKWLERITNPLRILKLDLRIAKKLSKEISLQQQHTVEDYLELPIDERTRYQVDSFTISRLREIFGAIESQDQTVSSVEMNYQHYLIVLDHIYTNVGMPTNRLDPSTIWGARIFINSNLTEPVVYSVTEADRQTRQVQTTIREVEERVREALTHTIGETVNQISMQEAEDQMRRAMPNAVEPFRPPQFRDIGDCLALRYSLVNEPADRDPTQDEALLAIGRADKDVIQKALKIESKELDEPQITKFELLQND